jgi:hypothetical protein
MLLLLATGNTGCLLRLKGEQSLEDGRSESDETRSTIVCVLYRSNCPRHYSHCSRLADRLVSRHPHPEQIDGEHQSVA